MEGGRSALKAAEAKQQHELAENNATVDAVRVLLHYFASTPCSDKQFYVAMQMQHAAHLQVLCLSWGA
jgi:hypothetical protein